MTKKNFKIAAAIISGFMFFGCASDLSTSVTGVSNLDDSQVSSSGNEDLSFNVKKKPPHPPGLIKLMEQGKLPPISEKLMSSIAPPPPPPAEEPAPTEGSLDCPLPPLPPPEVMSLIQTENPGLYSELLSMQSLTFIEYHNRMVDLSAEYPQYFPPPPPLPEDGTCPPPPPPPPVPDAPPPSAEEPAPAPDAPPPPPPVEEPSPPPPAEEPAPTEGSLDCPLPPLPPPEVMSLIQTENPSLYSELLSMQSLTFIEYHNRMVDLSAEYPQYFPPPPPLPEDGTCPPPPPPPPHR